MTTKAHVRKEKIGKLDFIQIKNFCTSKDTINSMKRQPTEWKKKSASHIVLDKELISSIYKEFLQDNNNNNKTKQIDFKAKDLKTLIQRRCTNGQ